MKCSLLTLSTFIDGALPADRGAEVDAHLVGCPRCTAGAATLREEKGRIAQLARVRVQPESAQTLLEQVGISGALPEQLQRGRPEIAVAQEGRPWLSGGAGAALPWSPRRPSAPPPRGDPFPFTEEQIVPTVRADVQPDLPFDGTSPAAVSAAPPDVEATPQNPGLDFPPPSWTDAAEHASPSLEPWEAAIPAYSDPGTVDAAWAPSVERPRVDPAPAAPPPAPPPTPAADEVAPAAELPLVPPVDPSPSGGPPQRLEAASGPRALFDRARDAVAVRLALSRRGEVAADAVDVVHHAAPVQRLPPPLAGFETPETTSRQLPTPARGAAEVPPRPAAATERMIPVPAPVRPAQIADPVDDRPMELTGFTDAPLAAPSRASSIRALRERAETDDAAAGNGGDGSGNDGSWNAFGAAAFRGEATPAAEASAARAPRRPLGRHSRAVQRRSVGIGARLSALVGAVLAPVRGGSAPPASSTRGADGVVPGGGTSAAPRTGFSIDRRVALAVGGVVAIFLVALLIGHLGSHTPTASRVTQSTAPAVAPHSAAASAAATAPPATAGRPTTTAPLPAMQTFGKGGSGFQVIRMRYGVFNGSQRIVVDLGGTSGTATGEPLTTIGFSGTTTMLMTFNGTIPASALATPPTGGVVTSITRVPSAAGTTTYRFTLSRAAKPVAFYLTGPLRFVLDLH